MPYKRLLSSLFTPKQAQQLRERVIEIVTPRFEQALETGQVDVVTQVMFPLMSELTMVSILGLDTSKATPYSGPVHHMTRRDYPRELAEQEMKWLSDQLRRDLADGSVDASSVLGRLTQAELDGQPIPIQALLNIAINLLIGGMGTTAFFTGGAVVFLGRNAMHRKQLLDEPTLVPAAVEELLRVFTPTQNFGRSIKQDVRVGGAQLRQGEKLLLGYGAANFDPRTFESPHVVDFRRTVRHMSFGDGPHRCLGSHLAKMIAATVIEVLLCLIPEYQLDEGGVKRNDAAASMFGYNAVPIRTRLRTSQPRSA
jgi:cytochrome P450